MVLRCRGYSRSSQQRLLRPLDHPYLVCLLLLASACHAGAAAPTNVLLGSFNSRTQQLLTDVAGISPKLDASLDTLLSHLLSDCQKYGRSWQGKNNTDPAITKLMEAGVALTTSKTKVKASPSAYISWMSALTKKLAEVEPHFIQPVYRRLVVAMLAKQAAAAGMQPLHEQLTASYHAVLLKLYTQHQQSSAVKSIMEYFHISKTGGTSMCKSAAEEGCTTMDFSDRHTCLIRGFDDGPRWMPLKSHTSRCAAIKLSNCTSRTYPAYVRFGVKRKNGHPHTCDMRMRALRDRGWNFYANEYTLYGGRKSVNDVHLCSQFVNVVLVREPKARLLSHIKFLLNVYQTKLNGTTTLENFFGKPDAKAWQAMLPAAVDNYYIRSLLGESVYHSKVGSISSRHAALARSMLTLFDVILVLEHDAASTTSAFEYGMGWHHHLHEKKARSSSSFEARELIEKLVPSDIDVLYKRNSHDQEVYTHARLLSLLDALVWGLAADVDKMSTKKSVRLKDGNSTADWGGLTQDGLLKSKLSEPPGFRRACGFFLLNETVTPVVPKWVEARENRKERIELRYNTTGDGALGDEYR